MLTEQEKLKDVVTKMSTTENYRDMLKEHQDLTLGMISTIEEQQQKVKDAELTTLLHRLEQLEEHRKQDVAQVQANNEYYQNMAYIQSIQNVHTRLCRSTAKGCQDRC